VVAQGTQGVVVDVGHAGVGWSIDREQAVGEESAHAFYSFAFTPCSDSDTMVIPIFTTKSNCRPLVKILNESVICQIFASTQ